MKVSVVLFPGSNCDEDIFFVLNILLGCEAYRVWHTDTDLKGSSLVVLPGGFSYGDYLRSGVLASFSPVIESIKEFALKGGLVLGICNGFQILLEAGLLEGALRQNVGTRFVCKSAYLRIESNKSFITALLPIGKVLNMPIAHHEGNYYAPDGVIYNLDQKGQVLLRYVNQNGHVSVDSNPNGSTSSIAGICNERGNVVGLMPHPERASERILGSDDGLKLLESACYR